jgi:5-methylcytosine-specific restriction endonuclease McrBC GTP-binding regulatory subunit McrB
MALDSTIISNNLKNITDQTILISSLIENDNALVDHINTISSESKESLNNYYQVRSGIIIDIRKFVANTIINRNITLSEIKNLENEKRALKPDSFRSTKKLYSILFPFVTADLKPIRTFIEELIQKLIIDLELDGIAKPTFFDFNGPRQQGSNRLWFALYNKTQPDQSSSKQIFFNFYNGEFSYGLYEHKTKQNITQTIVSDFTTFDYETFLRNLRPAATAIKNDIKNDEIDILDLAGHKLFKISHGSFKTPAERETLEKFKENRWIVIHELTGRQADGSTANSFKQEIKKGDYVYITIGGNYLYNIAKVVSDDWEYVPLEITEEEGWIFKQVEYIKEPVNSDLSELKSYNTKTYPSYRSTIAEISRDHILEEMNEVLFTPHYNVKFINSDNTSPISNELTKQLDMKESELNTILFGPPGTGKTYSTIERGISIANPKFPFPADPHSTNGRNIVKTEFEKLQNAGRITITTFHQSLSYEDFIEGIKPELEFNDENKLTYTLKPGIFKKCCALASYLCYAKSKEGQTNQPDYDFDTLYDAFIDFLQSQLDAGQFPEFQTIQGKLVEVKKINNNDSIIARAKNSKSKYSAPLTKENLQKLYDKYENITEINSLQQVKETVQVQPRITEFYAIFKGLKEFEKNFSPDNYSEIEEEDLRLNEDEIIKKFESGVFNEAVRIYGKESDKVVLIIDEINRGNVSSVFGELITLIEKDKRWGESEQLKLTLPYSQKDFFVPNNLYIIGTMNTADRSVESLDTALRRRFAFEPIMPSPDKLEDTTDGIELKKLLSTINERLAILKDSDHVIGHAWLWGIKNITELRSTFGNKIMPLLQEYFFNDYEKIGLVLGDNFFNPPLRIKSNVFASFKPKSGLDQQYNNYYQYTLKGINDLSKEDFTSIYTKSSTATDYEDE